ncbi:hypothetical protein AVEN_103741-1 [Araneus ventricosus]|uniref:Uncharacterized protein n=1 Tax=Araneus ventricosus TaxID=182803 RepID=A0A4Y2K6Y4_ARAVE|nr:hypothetical protein AVEN_103741-1 [Araneus ventricosus]
MGYYSIDLELTDTTVTSFQLYYLPRLNNVRRFVNEKFNCTRFIRNEEKCDGFLSPIRDRPTPKQRIWQQVTSSLGRNLEITFVKNMNGIGKL